MGSLAWKNLNYVGWPDPQILPVLLLLSEKNSFLVEEFMITYAPASSIFYYCQQRETKPGASFLGMALADLEIGRHSNLPGTQTEVDLLSQLYPQFEGKYGPACQKTYVKENIQKFDYVHIATHGVFNEQESVYSYLLMAPTDKDDGKWKIVQRRCS